MSSLIQIDDYWLTNWLTDEQAYQISRPLAGLIINYPPEKRTPDKTDNNLEEHNTLSKYLWYIYNANNMHILDQVYIKVNPRDYTPDQVCES